MAFHRINPATEETLGEFPLHDEARVQFLLAQAESAFSQWRLASFPQRAGLMNQAAQVLRRRVPELAALMTLEMGKPIADAEAEIEKCAAGCEFFAAHAADFLAEETIASDAQRSFVRYDPLGPVLAIMPWNFPFWQVFRFAAPALMAGNVGLLKHAPNVPGCAMAIESVFMEAGFPPGVFTSLLIDAPAVGPLIEGPTVRAVTLTGSERAGMAVAAQAGRALKKTVLELGGSDPFIVLPDADPELTAAAAAAARTVNSGQSCIAAKRFITVGPNAAFSEGFANRLQALRVGDPMNRETQLGPLARLDLLENLHRQVAKSVEAGARLVTGGQRVPRRGYYYAPTLLAGVRPGMPAFDEETFGPVAALIEARDIDDAIDLANQTPYGLGASLWTSDPAAAEPLAARLDAGMVFINGPVKSDPQLPFGGTKRSGYGRELSSAGLREFVNMKTVWRGRTTTESRRHREE